MMRHDTVAVGLAAALAFSSLPAQAQAPLWRTVVMSRQLRDTMPQRIRVMYGAGRLELRGTQDPVLYAMRLTYDQRRATPLHRYDADQRSTVLGLESIGRGLPASRGDRDDESGALSLALPASVPLDLDLELGGTLSSLELGGLTLRSMRLECGATDAALLFSTPNRTRMRDLEIDVGAADFSAVRLANANAEQVRVRGGVGVVDLDFGGTWTQDMNVVARLAVGKLTLRIPSDVGVRLEVQRVAAGFEHDGFLKRDDAWYSDNYDAARYKLRLRAETHFGQIDIQRTPR